MLKDFATLKRMFDQLRYVMTDKQKKHAVVIFFLIIIGAAFETLGVSSILPFIQALMEMDHLHEKWYFAWIIQIFHIQSPYSVIYVCAAFIILVYIIKNIFLFMSSRIQSKFRCRFQKDLSVKMLASFMQRPYIYFLDVNSSEIMRTLLSDVFGVFSILKNGFQFLAELFSVFLLGLFAIYTDPVMAFGVLTIAGMCFGGITLIFKNKLSAIGKLQRAVNAERQKCSYQAVTGYKEVKVMQRMNYFVNAYEEAYEEQRRIEVEVETISAMPERLIESICIAGLIIVVCIRLAIGVDIQEFIPKLSVFAVTAFRVLPSISRMTGYLNNLVFYRPTLEAVAEELKEVEKYQDFVNQRTIRHIDNDEQEKYVFQNILEIKNITWKYPGIDRYVLNGLSLKIQKGDSVALIGQSGAGKTTIADVIMGLLIPESGTVEMDGINITTMPQRWSRIIGYVPQATFLTDDTIRANIAFGIPKDEIDDKKIWDALEQSQLKEFVQGLPAGLNTIAGESGVRFSGGQRQRIAIARALYHNPAILVLDEATSALDNETENAVMESIEMLQGHKTLIIVAHRLTTIRKCNKIYEIVDGKAVLREKQAVLNEGIDLNDHC